MLQLLHVNIIFVAISDWDVKCQRYLSRLTCPLASRWSGRPPQTANSCSVLHIAHNLTLHYGCGSKKCVFVSFSHNFCSFLYVYMYACVGVSTASSPSCFSFVCLFIVHQQFCSVSKGKLLSLTAHKLLATFCYFLLLNCNCVFVCAICLLLLQN